MASRSEAEVSHLNRHDTPAFRPGEFSLKLENKNVLKIARCNEPFGHIIPLWHPEGQKILYDCGGCWKELGIQEGIYIYDTSSEKLRIFNEQVYRSEPLWSPEGNRIIYCPGSWENISVINADGTNDRVIVYPPHGLKEIKDKEFAYSGNAIDRVPYWNRNGTRIIFNRYYDLPACRVEGGYKDPEIWIVNLDGTGLTKLAEKGCYLFGNAYWGD